jgi:hypothetical protein
LLHPIGFGEAGDSLKGSAEGAVTLVTAPFCQSKHGDGTVSLSCFTIEADEVVNAAHFGNLYHTGPAEFVRK